MSGRVSGSTTRPAPQRKARREELAAGEARIAHAAAVWRVVTRLIGRDADPELHLQSNTGLPRVVGL